MESYKNHAGTCVPLDRNNIDTDQIIPKQFLKRIERTGFGQFLFFDWRTLENGDANPDFVLNKDRYKKATILVTGANFGCGSSREHAPWAIQDYGFKAIIAPSFADIFKNNCYKNSILPIELPIEKVEKLMSEIENSENYELLIDLESQSLTHPNGEIDHFELDSFPKFCLLNGLDEIGWTLQFEPLISDYESSH